MPLLPDLCLSSRDLRLLEATIQNPSQAFLLVGDIGIGKFTVAMAMASHLTNNADYNQLVISSIGEKSSSISIEQARQIKKFFTLRSSDKSEKRVVVIEKAENITLEAQNALLKILEEPPKNCYIILTSARPWRLLSTITSRVQTYMLQSPTKVQLQDYLISKSYSSKNVQSALQLTGNRVGIAVSILDGSNEIIVSSVQDAKDLFGMQTLDRLKLVDKLSKDRSASELRVHGLKIIAEAMLSSSIENHKDTKKWSEIVRSISRALHELEQNASTKLVLTNLFLSL